MVLRKILIALLCVGFTRLGLEARRKCTLGLQHKHSLGKPRWHLRVFPAHMYGGKKRSTAVMVDGSAMVNSYVIVLLFYKFLKS